MKVSYPLITSLMIIVIISFFISCGEDDKVISPTYQIQSNFEAVLDFSAYEGFYDVEETNDGNLLAGGYILFKEIDSAVSLTDTVYNEQAFLAKINNNGDTVWTATFGELYKNERVSEIRPLVDGSFMVLSTIMHQGGISSPDLRFQKVLSNGELGTYQVVEDISFPYIADMKTASDNGFILCGNANGFMQPANMIVLKINQDGSKDWSKTFDKGTLYSVKESIDGKILTAETFRDTTDDTRYIYMMELNSSGDSLLASRINLSDGNEGIDVEYHDNGYRVLARTYENDMAAIAHIELDSTAKMVSVQMDFSDYYYWPYDGHFTGDGGAVFCGSQSTTVSMGYLEKADGAGGIEWSYEFDSLGHNIYFQNVCPTSDGGFAVAGFIRDNTDYEYDSRLLKFNSSGMIEP